MRATTGGAPASDWSTARRTSRIVVPAPGRLSISSLPPARSTTRRTSGNPSPVPSPRGFVVKNMSIAWRRTSSVMPAPLSSSSTTTVAPDAPARARRTTRDASGARPAGIASAAFTSRLSMARVSACGAISTGGSPSARSTDIVAFRRSDWTSSGPQPDHHDARSVEGEPSPSPSGSIERKWSESASCCR